MLKLKNIKKTYEMDTFKVEALKGINLEFRKSEFVSILGHSGCGKTTLLNIIGGLDKYTSGDLIINSISTKKFKDKDWDAYRNYSIGFVFQSYNLIPHLSVLNNVEMALTLSGISAKVRKQKAMLALEKVGLKKEINKKPNQLSGGQMQRVAIARAIVNEPDIILADEPTGALDSATSTQVIDLLKEISADKLVVMVTHNSELAQSYSTRIIKLVDGLVVEDTNPFDSEKGEVITSNFEDVEPNIGENTKKKRTHKLKKTSMSFLTALNLSFKNLLTKKTRAIITSIAASIGIIGVSLVLAVSNGFNNYLDNFQKQSMMSLPIIYSQESKTVDFNKIREDMVTLNTPSVDSDEVDIYSKKEKRENSEEISSINVHKNTISEEFVEYIDDLNSSVFGEEKSNYATISKNWGTLPYFVNKNKIQVAISNDIITQLHTPPAEQQEISDKELSTFQIINDTEYLNQNYTLLGGRYPTNKNEIVLFANARNELSIEMLLNLGYELNTENIGAFSISSLLEQNVQIKYIPANVWFTKVSETEYSADYSYSELPNSLYNNVANQTLSVVGVIKGNTNNAINMYNDNEGIAYLSEFADYVHSDYVSSEIGLSIQAEILKNTNTAGISINGYEITKSNLSGNLLKYFDVINYAFGGYTVPYSISIYCANFDLKEKVIKYLNDYNLRFDNKEDYIVLTDYAETISSMFGEVLDIVSIVLIAFASISLVVSSVMIGIITYVSVIERTKEIGVLRAMGARKKDVARVFIAETVIIGFVAGALGMLLSGLLSIPINIIVHSLEKTISQIAIISVLDVAGLILLSMFLTFIAGLIPARIASKKDPVVALRTE